MPGGAQQHFSDLNEYTMNPMTLGGGEVRGGRDERDRREGEKEKEERRGERGALGERKND